MALVIKYDPFTPKMNDAKNLEEALKKSEVIVVATAHSEFKKITPKLLKKHNIKIVIDGKNCLNKNSIKKENIIYKGIGH